MGFPGHLRIHLFMGAWFSNKAVLLALPTRDSWKYLDTFLVVIAETGWYASIQATDKASYLTECQSEELLVLKCHQC